MHKAKQFVAMLLAVTVMVTGMPYEILSVNAAETENVSEENAVDDYSDEDMQEGVVIESENTENSTTFDLGNCQRKTVFYSSNVRFTDENGELQEYDPSLTEITEEETANGEDLTGYAYENEAGDTKQYLPEMISGDTPILMENDSYGIRFYPVLEKEQEEDVLSVDLTEGEVLTAENEVVEKPTTAVYDVMGSSFSMEYVSTDVGVKENLILDEVPDTNQFCYVFTLKGMYAKKNEVDRGITFYSDEDGEEVAAISAPYMNDATQEAYSEDLEYELEELESDSEGERKYLLKMTVSEEYLNDPERVYPVTIDPTTTWKTSDGVADSYVCSGSTYSDYNFYTSGVVAIAVGHGTKGKFRTYIKFPELTSTVKGKSVTSAKLSLYQTADTAGSQVVEARRVKESWKLKEITWNNRPSIAGTAISTVKTSTTAKAEKKLDLLSYVEDVADGTSNYGICLINSDETTNKVAQFLSCRSTEAAYRPKFVVTYYDKPTAPSSVSVSKSLIKKGDTGVNVSWAGVVCNSGSDLSSVQYVIKNSAGTTVVDYTATGKATESGTAAASKISTLSDGTYKLYVRGVNKASYAGPIGSNYASFTIDGTVPVISGAKLSVSSGESAPTKNLKPVLSCTVTDANISTVQYFIDGTLMGNMTKGSGNDYSVTADMTKFASEGKHTLAITATDKVGYTATATVNYYLADCAIDLSDYMPTKLNLQNSYGKAKISWTTEKDLIKGKVLYEIYRGETADFTVSDDTLVQEVTGSYWVDITSAADKTYYYKIKVVQKNSEGTIVDSVLVDQVLSGQGTEITGSETTGSKTYRSYFSFSTPNGSGTVEKNSGNLLYEQEDASLATEQVPFTVTRYYNSQSEISGMLGKGWSDSLHKELYQGTDGQIYFADSDGSIYTFEKEGNAYVCTESKKYVLTDASTSKVTKEKTSGKTEEYMNSGYIGTCNYTITDDDGNTCTITDSHAYTIKDKDGIFYRFNEFGQLVADVDPSGTFVYYAYDRAGNLQTVESSSGKKITLSYDDEKGLLESIALPDKTEITYIWDEEELSAVKRQKDADSTIIYPYVYNEDGKLVQMNDAVGNPYGVTYAGDKVEKVTYPQDEAYELTYSDGKTEVTKLDQEQEIYTTSTTLDPTTGKVLSEKDISGIVTSYEYAFEGNPYLVTETRTKTGYETISGRQLVFKTKDKIETITYDEDTENILYETDENGETTSYTYAKSGSTEWNEDLEIGETVVKEGVFSDTLIRETETSYNEAGRVTEEKDVTDAEHITIEEYTYDAHGNVTESVSKEQDSGEEAVVVSTEETEYSADGNATKEVTASGKVQTETESEYDSMGNILSSVEYDMESAENNGEDYKEKQSETINAYDELGRLTETTEIVNGYQESVSSVYDDNGTLLSETDERGVTTTYCYDSKNRLTETTTKDKEGNIKNSRAYEYSYEDITVRDRGVMTTIQNVSVKTEKDGNENVISISYNNPSGQQIRSMSQGLYTDYSYDINGNLVVTTEHGTDLTSEDKISITLYNENGYAFETVTGMAASGSQYIITDDMIETLTSYDDKGNVIAETDGEGTRTTYAYDDSNRVTSITENAGTMTDARTVTVGYETTDDGTVTTETDALGHQNIEKVNEAGLVTESQDTGDENESIVTSKTYDANGNLSQTIYANGAKVTNTYNAAGMVTEIVRTVQKDGVDQAESKTTYTYEDNRLKEMIDWNAQLDGTYEPWHYTCYGYDTFGRTEWVAEVDGSSEPTEEELSEQKISYVYDAEDNVIQVNYAQNTNGIESIYYTYDANQWLKSISVRMGDGSKNLLRSYTYDSYGKVSRMTEYPGYATGSKANAVVKTYSYDDFDRMTDMVYQRNGTILESYEYEYDRNSNITKAVLLNETSEDEADWVDETRSYTYNSLGQLTQTVITDQNNSTRTISYTYDKAGNRIRVQENKETAETTSYVYNGLDQLVTETTVDGSNTTTSITYAYDANGNQIRETDSSMGITVESSYDAENQLTQTAISQNGTVTLTQKNRYNGSGQRSRKTEICVQDEQESTETTCYHYQDGTVSYTTDSTGEKMTQYLLGTEGNVIGLEQSITLPDEDDTNLYYVYDKDIQGSTTSILDDQGEGTVSYEYTDFGETTIHESDTNQAKNEVCYTGGIYDESTGLYYLNARYYDPGTGVFLTEDSYRGETDSVDTWNLYAYCSGNPVNYVDPSGHDAIWLHSEKGAYGFGHAALLIEFKGNWRYYSWEQDGYKSSTAKLKKVSKGVKKKSKKVYQSINKSNNVDIGERSKKPYTHYVWINGDFSKSYYYAKKIRDGKTKFKKYSVTKCNCAWIALQILRHGNDVSKKQQEKIYNLQYSNVEKKKIVNTPVPEWTLRDVSSIFNSKIKIME